MGKDYTGLQDEWNQQRVIDFNENFERVSKSGKN